MAGAKDKSKLGYRILLGVVVLVLGGSMLLYLVPQSPVSGEISTETVAQIGDESVSVQDVRQQLNQIEQRNQNMKPLEALYAQQILRQLVFEKEIEYEAKRLGITVSDQERADRIRQYVPTVFNGGTFVGMDRYSAEVQARFQLTVPVFEELIRQGLLEEKFRKLVTDGVSVGPAELQEEIRKKAEDVLKQAKKGGKFEELAKKYSEDAAKDKGGDIGWIGQGQALPEYEKAAFSLPVGSISDLVRTQIGIYIIKVLEKETAHTKPFEEVKESLRMPLLLSQADKLASDTSDQLSAAIRQSNKISLDDLAKQHHLVVGETRLISATDPLLELANSQDAKNAIFLLRIGELNPPVRTDRGYVVLSVKSIQPAHQDSLEETRDRAIPDLKSENPADR